MKTKTHQTQPAGTRSVRKEEILMKEKIRTIKMILDIVAAVAVAAGGVLTKYYLDGSGT